MFTAVIGLACFFLGGVAKNSSVYYVTLLSIVVGRFLWSTVKLLWTVKFESEMCKAGFALDWEASE